MARRNSPVAEPARPEVLAFLDDIKRNPDDDTPRLILADWLEEHDDPRGEFLRVQCELASLAAWDPRRKELQQREGQILKARRRSWGRPWQPWGYVSEYERGLGYLRRSAFSLQHTVEAPWDRLSQTEDLGWVDRFDFQVTSATSLEPHERFMGSPLLRHLVGLNMWLPSQATAALELLVACANSPYLSSVRLRLPIPLSDSVRVLAHSPLARQLRQLALAGDQYGPDEIETLASSPCLTRLTHLNLSFNRRMGAAGVRAVVSSPHLAALGVLELRFASLGAEGVAALAAGGLPSLHTLDLGDNNLRVAGAEALAAVSRFSLRKLDLSSNGLTYRAAAALAGSPLLDSLTHLNLLGNPLKDNGVQVLTGSPRLARLTRLSLLNTQITDEGAKALAASPYLGSLTSLDVSYNRIGRAGKRALRERFGTHAVRIQEHRR
jgi:uncharacterized protein (TIGR02996 family)